MLWLSELLLQNPELDSFLDLEALIRTKASEGERFYQSDVEPLFPILQNTGRIDLRLHSPPLGSVDLHPVMAVQEE